MKEEGIYRSGVGILLVNKEGLIFAGQRRDISSMPDGNPSLAWQMPQGGIEEGESPEEAALRELYEETGVRRVEILDVIPTWISYDYPPDLASRVFGGAFRGQRHRWFACSFIGQESEINLSAFCEKEFEKWRWMTAQDLYDHVVDFRKPAYLKVFEAFKAYCKGPSPILLNE